MDAAECARGEARAVHDYVGGQAGVVRSGGVGDVGEAGAGEDDPGG